MVNDIEFENSYKELMGMFDGSIPYSLKRAEFLVENAYYGGSMDYAAYCHDIDSVVHVLNRFIDINNLRSYRTAPNFAIFEYFTKSSPMNGNKKFVYNIEDPLGNNDFSVYFVTRTLRTHVGQCASLSLSYKILCDELGGESFLALAPFHVYIKHVDEEGRWANIELTHGGFVRDVWMMESLNISTEAIRSGIFLCALSEKENIAFMLVQLMRAYVHKYKSWDYFSERGSDAVLAQLPHFCEALVQKFNLYQNRGLNFQAKYGDMKTPYQDDNYANYWSIIKLLDKLGYSQPTLEEYNQRMEEAVKFVKEHEK